jgi:hypothetical protein
LKVPVVVREQRKRSVAGFSYHTGSKQHYEELGSTAGRASAAMGDSNSNSSNSSSSRDMQQILQVVDKLAAEKLSRTTRRVLSSSSSSDAAAKARVKQQLQEVNELHVQFCSDFGRACR